MDISEDRITDVVILGLSGKLDATTAKSFEDKILADIEAGDRRVVIDLSQLDYVSSSGLRVFLIAAKRLRSKDGKIALCSLKDDVQHVFDLSGFSSILAIYGSKACNLCTVHSIPTRPTRTHIARFVQGSLPLRRSAGACACLRRTLESSFD
jgi:anti-anti-sigma factor